MSQIRQKINKYFSWLIRIAVVVAVVCIIVKPFYAFALLFSALYIFDNRHKVKPALVIVAYYSIIGYPSVLLTEYFVFDLVLAKEVSDVLRFFVSVIASFFIFIVPYGYFAKSFLRILIAANYEKDNYEVISKYPYLICKEHLTRTRQFSIFGFKSAHCRISRKCFENKNIIKVVKLVGLIGAQSDGEEVDNEFFVTLWEPETEEIRYGDYDIIEIHENDAMVNVDFVISKVLAFFNNEIERFKPVDETTVRIVGKPNISENSKRMLKRHFYTIEYIEV